ncbi:hypothetical protein PK35_15885 [Tamlana nanhaiensis]|uniref:DUF4270 domain-containing protein n=1 Tax=Neotamlana nanhaiensis TaxID=1382798 RepID=A0A0D7VWR5_9FLAO|nr:DUF4270 domain-containing protein [Tamlana nanhaiensis]KJD31310.1 hypothetical protein PK35_15885 [Tamlana nanhaiensis]
MKKNFNALKFPVAFLILAAFFIACDRDFNVIESDVLGKDNTNFSTKFKELPVVAYNKKLDSVQINSLSSNMLGVFNDPAYGLTSASIVAQVTPSTYSPDFGTNPEIESVVLNIPYYSTIVNYDTDGNAEYQLDSIYGNTSAPIKLSVYQNDYFLRDGNPNSEDNSIQNYFSNSNSSENSMFTGTFTINFDEHAKEKLLEIPEFKPSEQSIQIITDTDTTYAAPALRHTITNPDDLSFWYNTFIAQQDAEELNNLSKFKKYFRGLYIKAESTNGDGSMALLNLASTDASITINYTKDSTTEGERTDGTYVLTFTGNIVNPIINNYNLVTIPTPNKTEGDDKLYLKGQAGSMAIVDLFPNGVQAFKDEFLNGDDNLAKLINEVHLEVYEDSLINTNPYGENYHRYDRIYAYDIINNTYTYDYVNDLSANTSTPVNSRIISLSQRDTISGMYKIRLTDHFYNLLLSDSETENTKIGLVISNNVNYTDNAEILNSEDEVIGIPAATFISPRGTILHGSNATNENRKLKLKIFFTEPN